MPPIETLTTTEVQSLLLALREDPTWHNQPKKATRNFLMASLMVDAGLRNAEVAQLPTLSLINADRPPFVLVLPGEITKTKLPRAIPLSNRLKDAIRDYLTYFDHDPQRLPPRFAFPNYSPDAHLSTRQIHRIIADASHRSIGRRIHPHILRHTFATSLMRTSNSRIVQELLGHKRLTSTQVYTHPNATDLRTAIDSLDPSTPVDSPVTSTPPTDRIYGDKSLY